ncbi:uncharacterized protein BDR25DRAFT_350426 [Lindgomyces ingoldianus]|uniref:Uncharacterized protein n=1 Tax=Lindgomyces ingoldianus TaxID=673940 RepID=A0ACB6RAB6_9PLEO|nr:uncharacterized protein BDR25DRAFT_350426 [Lindgomyces ingoldianus]KAF2476131.1 hypothetical protein BDR25DRAFT_350426 [Lindgomyces ingoldianus]
MFFSTGEDGCFTEPIIIRSSLRSSLVLSSCLKQIRIPFYSLNAVGFHTIFRPFRKKKENNTTSTIASEREYRVEAITRFVLALSNQQLVTGLAILTSTLVNHCSLHTFRLLKVNSIAYFSTTTHLVTIKSLLWPQNRINTRFRP